MLVGAALTRLKVGEKALDDATLPRLVRQRLAHDPTRQLNRQRADLGAVSSAQTSSMFSVGTGVGSGVQVTGISRASDPFLDAKLRSQTSDAAYLAARADAYSTLESGLGEPGDGRTKPGPDITFYAEAPSAGTYRLYLDFQHGGKVRTAEFTVTAGPSSAPVEQGGQGEGHGEHTH